MSRDARRTPRWGVVVLACLTVGGAATLGILVAGRDRTARSLGASAGPSSPAGQGCSPASPSVGPATPKRLRGYTYLLSPPPPGYQPISAAGSLTSDGCTSTVWWSVTYDRRTGSTLLSGVDLSVTSAAAGLALNPQLAVPASTASTYRSPHDTSRTTVVQVGGRRGLFGDLGDGVGRLIWIANGHAFELAGPITDSKPDSLLQLTKSLRSVDSTDAVAKACRDAPPRARCAAS